MKKKKEPFKTILFKTTMPMSLIMIAQMVIIIVTVVFGSTFNLLKNGIVESFEGKVNLKTNYVENNMLSNWSNMRSDYDIIQNNIKRYLDENNLDTDELLSSHKNSAEALTNLTSAMNLLLRKNKVTDAFIILDNNVENSDQKNGIYIRDRNPDVNSVNNSDILIEVASTSIQESLTKQGYDISVTYSTRFNIDDYNHDYYLKTINTGKENININPYYMGYWSEDFKVHNTEGISYQMPLIINEEVIGVVGVGITNEHFTKKMAGSFNDINNYCLVKTDDNNGTKTICTSLEDHYLKNSKRTEHSNTNYSNLYKLEFEKKHIYYFYSQEINLYGDVNIYDSDSWYLIGLITESDLFGLINKTTTQIYAVIFICLAIGIVAELIISLIISRPIIRVSAELEKARIDNIKKTNIKEIDGLLYQLQKYFAKSLELPDKINRLLNLADVNIAAFEYNYEDNSVQVTNQFYKILDIEDYNENCTIEEFEQLLKNVHKENISQEENATTFYLASTKRWIKIKRIKGEGFLSGVVQDITEGFLEKQQVEFERDYDVLTGLLNRRGFANKVEEVWGHEKQSALMMIDLDNLKYINDNYGHDFGDDYITLVAKEIKTMNSSRVITCHLSGDEFLIFAYNYDTKKEIKVIFENFNKTIRTKYLDLYGEKIYAKLSSGIAFLDSSTLSIEDLRKKAEFAMYEVKESTKNDSRFFSSERFESNKNKLDKIEKFNNLINNKLIKFAFQPIVDIRTKEVLGYEALMRSNVPEFKNPLAILKMAKKEGKLSKIESLTVCLALETYESLNIDKMLFINSLSNQILSEEDFVKISNQYSKLLKRTVIELTEEENQDEKMMKEKIRCVNLVGSSIAIDDYGTGYNNLSMILNYNSKYVKIEGSLIRRINVDKKKYTLAKSIIDYCHSYNIKVIAESVETIEELKVVYDLDVDYVQGYLIQKPEFKIKELKPEVIEILDQLNKK